ncbi:MAG TPA: alpha/beta fold hydrolase [Stellaceae bacterium]|nr:alpha/beta fold hydrolase [Stellaceae bacterium]
MSDAPSRPHAPRPRVPKPRLGPRPLPLHLLGANLTWQSSKLALPFLKSGLLPWSQSLSVRADELRRDLADIAPAEFAAALEAELGRRTDKFLSGVEAYRHHPYRRDMPEPPCIWQEGTTRLLDYGPEDGVPLLVVPSLINRAYVLDLSPRCSLLRYLSARGVRPLLVDWDRPGPAERNFDLTDYIAGRLDQAFEVAVAKVGSPLAVMGYCMGGLLSLALAERHQRDVASLVLMATPWDFHQDPRIRQWADIMAPLGSGAPHGPEYLDGPFTRWLTDSGLEALGEVPTDMLQAMFFMAAPQTGLRKFDRFAELDPDSEEAIRFVAIEDWINDGVPLALPTARDCLGGWYQRNDPAQHRWKVAGRTVDARRITRPALLVAATHDTLVPLATANALAEILPAATMLSLPLGHIGLVVATRAETLAWRPIADHVLSHRH